MNEQLANVFDAGNAARLVGFAKGAYGQGLDGTHVIEHAETDTRVVLSLLENDLVVAFRGTRSLVNFLTDVRCRRAPLFPGSTAEVHEGFYAAFEGVRHLLHEAITRLLAGRRDLRIWFTGHSLGGALAKLAGFHFASALTSVYTFGEPRVGNAAFRDLYDGQLRARSFRVVHADDVVPRVPWLLGAYRHCGHELFFPMANGQCSMANSQLGDQGEDIEKWSLRICYWQLDPSVWRKLPYDAVALVREWREGKLALLADHHVDSYCRLFSSALNLNPNLALNPVPSFP